MGRGRNTAVVGESRRAVVTAGEQPRGHIEYEPVRSVWDRLSEADEVMRALADADARGALPDIPFEPLPLLAGSERVMENPVYRRALTLMLAGEYVAAKVRATRAGNGHARWLADPQAASAYRRQLALLSTMPERAEEPVPESLQHTVGPPPRERYAYVGTGDFDRDGVAPGGTAEDGFHKPDFGLWTSPLDAKGVSAWETLGRLDLAGQMVYDVSPAPDARVLYLKSPDDMREFEKEFAHPHRDEHIDWDRVRDVADGVHLADGLSGATPAFRDWDIETMYWLNPRAVSVGEAQRNAYVQGDALREAIWRFEEDLDEVVERHNDSLD